MTPPAPLCNPMSSFQLPGKTVSKLVVGFMSNLISVPTLKKSPPPPNPNRVEKAKLQVVIGLMALMNISVEIMVEH